MRRTRLRSLVCALAIGAPALTRAAAGSAADSSATGGLTGEPIKIG